MESLSRSLSLDSLGDKALEEKQLIETTFSFTYNVFRSESLFSYLKEFPSGRFASQLALDILFSLCRVGEMWLTIKQGKDKHFLNGQLDKFFSNHHSRINWKDLATYNDSCKDDFEKGL